MTRGCGREYLSSNACTTLSGEERIAPASVLWAGHARADQTCGKTQMETTSIDLSGEGSSWPSFIQAAQRSHRSRASWP